MAMSEVNITSSYPYPIVRVMSSQLSNVKTEYGRIFYVTDENQLYFDTVDNARVMISDVNILATEADRENVIVTLSDRVTNLFYQGSEDFQNSRLFYVIETNILYRLINNSWSIVRGTAGGRISAQTYYPDGTLVQVYPDDVSTNGILGDGSVVVRDKNRTVCGLIHSNGFSTDISSFVGSQLTLNPSAVMKGRGSLVLNADLINNDNSSDNNNSALYNGSMFVFGSIKKVEPLTWNNRYRVLQTLTQITATTTLLKGCRILENSVLGDETVSPTRVLSEDITITSGSLVAGCKIVSGSVVNGLSLKPPFIFDTSVSAYVPDYQEVPLLAASVTGSDMTITGIMTPSKGSELFIHEPFSDAFNRLIINGVVFSLLTESDETDAVLIKKYALLKFVSDSEFIVLSGGEKVKLERWTENNKGE